MIAAPLAALSLVITVAAVPAVGPTGTPPPLSAHQRSAALQPLVRTATECIARTVAADPRAGDAAGNLGDLIVASVPACVDAVRAMIDAHDRYFGDGTGEAFFMGPYLDVLPKAVGQWVKDLAGKARD